MKRLLVRLSALIGVVAVGAAVIVEAQRSVQRAQAQEVSPTTASPAKNKGIAKSKKGITKSKKSDDGADARANAADPFARRRSKPRAADPFAPRGNRVQLQPRGGDPVDPPAQDESRNTDLSEPALLRAGAAPAAELNAPDDRSGTEPYATDGVGQSPPEGSGRPGQKLLEGPQAPAVTLEKVAPAEVQVGKPAVFQLHVRNTGNVPAHNVQLEDDLPQGAQLLSTNPQAQQTAQGQLVWTLGTLKPGEEMAVEVELMPTAEGELGSVATIHLSGQASARTRSTRPQLELVVSAPRQVLIGENASLVIKITNPGTGVATGVVLMESIPDEFTHPAGPELEYEVGDLKPNETRQVELTLKAARAGRVANRLAARGDGQLRADFEVVTEVVAPQLAVDVQGPKRRFLERQATYTVSVSNPGTASAKEVELVTHLPKGLKFVEANNAGQYDPSTNSVHWMLEELPPNETGEVRLTTLPVEAGEQMLRIESTADKGLAAEKQETITIEGVAAILFQVADVADPIEVGGETTYEIHVVNQGSKAATNVQLSVLLPSELKATGAEGPTRHEVVDGQVQFLPLARLAPKADTTYRVRVEGLEAGDLRVQVQLQTDEMQRPVTKEESTHVYADE